MSSFLLKLTTRLKAVLRWMEQSYIFKITLFILILWIGCSIVYSRAEGTNFFNGFFYILMNLFGEVSNNPTTLLGKISVVLILCISIMLFAIIIGEISKLLLQRLLNREKPRIKRYYNGTGQIVICGVSSNILGILRELRSKDLEKGSHAPVVIISENIDSLVIPDPELRKNVFGINGNVLVEDDLKRAGLERAKSILILPKEGDRKSKKSFRDSYTALVYKAIHNYLSLKENRVKIKNDINVVLEFLDDSVNLLPCSSADPSGPAVYKDPIGKTGRSVIVEAIFLEKLSTYLFVQSLMNREINNIVQRLLTTQIYGTNEFYYHTVGDALAGKGFHDLERTLLKTNATALGVLRRNKEDESSLDTKLLLNPAREIVLKKGDRIVLITYNERELRRSTDVLKKGVLKTGGKKPDVKRSNRGLSIPFRRLFILNWNRPQIRDVLIEVAKIVRNAGVKKRLGVTILTRFPSKELEPEFDEVKQKISKVIGADVEKILDINLIHGKDPLKLATLKKAGIQAKDSKKIRVLILSEDQESEEADLRVLYQSQLIENRISKELFTCVELTRSNNLLMFDHSYIDVVVSVDDFCAKLLAQAILKPYISLVFRNLLTFSEDTNEFYIRDVPATYVGKTILKLQEDLIGFPVIFIGHIRSKASRDRKGYVTNEPRITINPLMGKNYDNSHIRYNRVSRTDKFQKGDRAILIAREPAIVDGVLERLH